jgi:hypothetical protein
MSEGTTGQVCTLFKDGQTNVCEEERSSQLVTYIKIVLFTMLDKNF